MLTATLEQRNAFSAAGVQAIDVDDSTLERELERMVLTYLDVRPAS